MNLRENYKIENDGIWIAKKELEEWRDHYHKTVLRMSLNYEQARFIPFYAAKHELVCNLLKMFDKNQ